MSVDRVRVRDVLELQRRAVTVDPIAEYEEIGIRSFGRGIFHKEPVSGADLGSKRVFRIESGDLVISNVFAWEGAVAVASDAETGRIGSHRFMTFVPTNGRIDSSWAAWFFRSEPGLELLRQASPGSAGRNRTLAIDRFEALEIPLPPIDEQRRAARYLDGLSLQVDHLQQASRGSDSIVSSLLLSWLESRFADAGEATTLDDLAEVFRGHGPRYQPGTGSIAINQACVRWMFVDVARAREVQRSWWLDVPENGRVRHGDVLVNSTGEGTIGRAAVADDGVSGLPFDSHVLVVRCDTDELLPEYLAAYLRSPSGQAQVHAAKGANTTKQTELGKFKLERLTLPTPSIAKQRSLVTAYERIVRRKRAIDTSLQFRSNCLAAMRPAALNQAFAGLS